MCSFLIKTTIALVENFKGISEGRDFVERLKAAKDAAENVAIQLVQDFLEDIFENVAQPVGCPGKIPKFLTRTLAEQFVSQMKNFFTLTYAISGLTTSLTLGQLVGFAATGGISGFLTYFAANVLTDIIPNLY